MVMMATRILALLISIFITQVVANTAVPDNPAVKDYGQHIHPPLVRNVRNLENELKDLPNSNRPDSNNGKKPEPFTVPSNTQDSSDEISTDPVVTSATDHSYDALPSNPAATEYMLTSKPTPQLPNIDVEGNIQLSSITMQDAGKVLDQSHTANDNDYDDDDGDDDESDEDSYNNNHAMNEKSANESHLPTITAPAYIRDAYFFAKEDVPDSKKSTAHPQSFLPLTENVAEDVLNSDFTLDQQVNYERSNENVEGQRPIVGQKELIATDSEATLDRSHMDMQNNDNPLQIYNSNDEDASLEIDITDETTDDRNSRPQHVESMQSVTETAVTHITETHNLEEFAHTDANAMTGDSEAEEEEDENSDSRTISNERLNSSSVSVDLEEQNVDDDYQNNDSKSREEIMNRFQAVGLGRKLVKKSMKYSPKNQIKLNRSENEEILQLMIKVAEDPKDWEEIRELLEKIQYNESTLKKAKSRLRALAKKQRIKNRKGLKGHKNEKTSNGHNLKNKALPKIPKQMTKTNFIMNSAMQGSYKSANKFQQPIKEPQDLIIATPHHDASPSEPRQSTSQDSSALSKSKSTYIKVSVFPAKLLHHGREPTKIPKGDDYAIERPVTVIGERSRVDPVEKQLLEASANQRLREIQQEKARLAAIAEPTDEMEKQLKALTKLEHRLMEHRRRKQKLLEKMHAKELQPSEQHSKW